MKYMNIYETRAGDIESFFILRSEAGGWSKEIMSRPVQLRAVLYPDLMACSIPQILQQALVAGNEKYGLRWAARTFEEKVDIFHFAPWQPGSCFIFKAVICLCAAYSPLCSPYRACTTKAQNRLAIKQVIFVKLALQTGAFVAHVVRNYWRLLPVF